MSLFSKIIATRGAVPFNDPAFAPFKQKERRDFIVPKGTSITEAVLLVHQSDFMPKDHTCSYYARLSLARYDPITKEIEFSKENLEMPDELHIHDACLYLSCSIMRAAALSKERKELLKRTEVRPPAKLLRRLVSAGFCKDFAQLCQGPVSKRGSVAFPALIKAAKEDSGLHVKKRYENDLVVQGLQKGVELTLRKTNRGLALTATIGGLPPNCFGLTYVDITNLCGDAMITAGHEYGSKEHMRHIDLPRIYNAQNFARIAKGYVDLAYKLHDVCLEFPDTGEKDTWRLRHDAQLAETMKLMEELRAAVKADNKDR